MGHTSYVKAAPVLRHTGCACVQELRFQNAIQVAVDMDILLFLGSSWIKII